MIGVVTASVASAQCPGTAQPFGPDDSGLLTCNKDISKCEQTVAGNVASTLVPGLIKCHSNQANLAFKGFPNSEDIGCEAPLIQKFLKKIDNAQCPCINPSAIANFYESTLDATNFLKFCDGWQAAPPCTGGGTVAIDPSFEDTGCVNLVNKKALKCADSINKCTSGLMKDWLKCHQTAAKNFVANKAFDEEACELGPIPVQPGKSTVERFNTCASKALTKGGADCAPCQAASLPTIIGIADTMIDGANSLIFCQSPSGAFLE